MTTQTKPATSSANSNSKSDQARALLQAGVAPGQIAKQVGCSRNLVYMIKAEGGSRKRGPGRPAKTGGKRKASASISSAAGIEGILAAVKGAEQERAKMLAALQKIHVVLADVLAK